MKTNYITSLKVSNLSKWIRWPNELTPNYIKDLLKYNDSRRTLRSSNNRLLDEPRANLKTYGERAFSVAAPRLWNKLPLQIRLSSSEAVFKANLKTYLFKRAFDL